ncbi:ImmA/IrrE family metallo-endopeptidase [Streptomyces kanamyceticus]|uniref:ImmA/IrrE family metallo-endopeptidase n=1 Tax=Streptomyces kanamyceticus TaxID=1967 RepID=A0A5J6G856_STRKN|nr:ImmA/IrrE family metallo-endopeptidase [Streptomyces kanamyceticus]QEU89961.1 ImmA/IrrE family metallo-endopeptidase [Streptomyces kanamyceticus]
MPGEAGIAQLCAHVSAERGRPVVTAPMDLEAPSPCGMWIAWQDIDVIVYASDTSPAHQDHIIVHELAHILCGHRAVDEPPDQGAVGTLFPDLDPALVRDALYRTAYTDPQEREAEMFASLFLKRAAASAPPEPVREVPCADAEIIARIEATLGPH